MNPLAPQHSLIGPPAVEILKKGLDDLQSVFTTLLEKFDTAVAADNYEKYPDLEV